MDSLVNYILNIRVNLHFILIMVIIRLFVRKNTTKTVEKDEDVLIPNRDFDFEQIRDIFETKCNKKTQFKKIKIVGDGKIEIHKVLELIEMLEAGKDILNMIEMDGDVANQDYQNVVNQHISTHNQTRNVQTEQIPGLHNHGIVCNAIKKIECQIKQSKEHLLDDNVTNNNAPAIRTDHNALSGSNQNVNEEYTPIYQDLEDRMFSFKGLLKHWRKNDFNNVLSTELREITPVTSDTTYTSSTRVPSSNSQTETSSFTQNTNLRMFAFKSLQQLWENETRL